MGANSNLRFEHFLTYPVWKEAVRLLTAQIESKKKPNRHYYNLSFFYFEKIEPELAKIEREQFFQEKVASNLFYGLENEFFLYPMTIPKAGIGLRKYLFFSVPMKVMYYAVGTYIVRLSQQLLHDLRNDNDLKHSYYGGNLFFDKEQLVLKPENLYYKNHYEAFQKKLQEEKNGEKVKDKVIIQLDIQNYFENILIEVLLNNLEEYCKPSEKKSLIFDQNTRELITFFFHFISNGEPGIPQSYSNVISNFIGYLYLIFGDLIIVDCINELNSSWKVVDQQKVLRYVDDTYISLTFKSGVSKKKKKLFIHELLNRIAEQFYIELNLRFNKKFSIHFMDNEKDVEAFTQKANLRSVEGEAEDSEDNELAIESVDISKVERQDVSVSAEQFFKGLKAVNKGVTASEPTGSNSYLDIKVPEMVTALFELLADLKKKDIIFIHENAEDPKIKETLQFAYDRNVNKLLEKPKNVEKLEAIFKNFEWELARIHSRVFAILISMTEKAKAEFEKFLLDKQQVTAFEADFILSYLAQNDFEHQELLQKLGENHHLQPIIDHFQNPRVSVENDYFDLPLEWVLNFQNDLNIYEQIRLRVYHEHRKEYSFALNHLLNELHAISRHLDPVAKSKGNNYNSNCVADFLNSLAIPAKTRAKIRNLFDRRNKNPISHPGEENLVAWAVTAEEYLDYKKYVQDCLHAAHKAFPAEKPKEEVNP
jgi:AbiA family abortive infection protein